MEWGSKLAYQVHPLVAFSVRASIIQRAECTVSCLWFWPQNHRIGAKGGQFGTNNFFLCIAMLRFSGSSSQGINQETRVLTLAGVAQWTECRPVNPRILGLIPGQGICLGCGPGTQLGVCKR